MTISQLIGFSTDSQIFHEMKNGEDSKNLEFSPFFSVPDVIRTRGLPLRRRLLYPFNYENKCRIFGLFSHFGSGNHIYESNHFRDELPLFLIPTSQATFLESNSKLYPFCFSRV